MINRTIVFACCILSILVLSSCEKVEPQKTDVTTVLDSLQEHFAPDGRVSVYDVKAEVEGNQLIVKGDVDNPMAKVGSVDAVKKLVNQAVLDSIRLLPDADLGEKKYGIVAVSVGNVRTKPGHPYELCTQVLMGTTLKLLKKHGGWYFVQMPDRYLGWFEESAMHVTTADGVAAWESAQKTIITNQYAIVRSRPSATSLPVSDAVAGDLFKYIGKKGRWTEVGIADGRTGFVESSNAEDYTQWKRSRNLTPDNIEKTAKLFIGVPYLWGGTSPKGMDCSGFTKTVFRLNGMELNRDADQQAQMGEAVEPGKDFSHLKKGDLLFFGQRASDKKPEHITHVGIYLGNEEFIHSPGGEGVRFNSFNPSAPDFSKFQLNRFVRARRVIGNARIPEVRTK